MLARAHRQEPGGRAKGEGGGGGAEGRGRESLGQYSRSVQSPTQGSMWGLIPQP